MRIVAMAKYTPSALKSVMEDPNRAGAVEKLILSVGGTMESWFFSRGEYDIVIIAQMPNAAASAAFHAAAIAGGALSHTSMHEELDMDAVVKAAGPAMAAYAPPKQ